MYTNLLKLSLGHTDLIQSRYSATFTPTQRTCLGAPRRVLPSHALIDAYIFCPIDSQRRSLQLGGHFKHLPHVG